MPEAILALMLYYSLSFLVLIAYRAVSPLLRILFIMILSNWAKRFIYISGDAGDKFYEIVLILGDVLLVFYMILYIKNLFNFKMDKISSFVMVFIVLIVVHALTFRSGFLITLLGLRILLLYISTYFLVFNSESNRAFYGFQKLLMHVAIIGGIYGIIQWYVGYFDFEKTWLESGKTSLGRGYFGYMGVYRYVSIFSGLRDFALFALMGLSITWMKWGTKKIALPYYILFITSLILSGSRGTLLGFFITMIIWCAKKPILIFYLFIIIVLPSSFMFISKDLSAFNLLFDFIPALDSPFLDRLLLVGSLTGRVQSWMELSKHDLLYGAGIGAYTSAAHYAGGDIQSGTDNIYVTIAGQMGIVGFIVFLLILIFHVSNYTKVKNSKGFVPLIYKISFLIPILLAMDGLFNPVLNANVMAILYWGCIALANSYYLNYHYRIDARKA